MAYYKASNSFIAQYYIFFGNSDSIVSSEACFYSVEKFFKSIYGANKHETIEEYVQYLKEYHYRKVLPSTEVYISNSMNNVINYMQSIPIDLPNIQKATVVFMIDEKEIYKSLEKLTGHEGGIAYIADQKGQIITSFSTGEPINVSAIKFDKSHTDGFTEVTIDGERMFVTYCTSPINGWKYVSVVPVNVVMAKLKYIRVITMWFILFVLLVGGFLAINMAKNNSEPFKQIASALMDNTDYNLEEKYGGMEFFKNAILRLVSDNKNKKIIMQKQIEWLKNMFLEKLIKGNFVNQQEVDALVSLLNINIYASAYVVLLIKIGGYDEVISKEIVSEMYKKRIKVRSLLETKLTCRFYMHDIGEDSIAGIFCVDDSDYQSTREGISLLINLFADEIYQKHNMRLLISAGGFSENLLDIAYSFEQAEQGMNIAIKEKTPRIIWYDSIKQNSASYYYPVEKEIRLIKFAIAGSIQEIIDILKTIYDENINKRSLNFVMINELIHEMKGTILKIINQMPCISKTHVDEITNKAKKVIFINPIQETFDMVEQIYSEICKHVQVKQGERKRVLVNNIVEYVDTNYLQTGFGLGSVAKQFGITEVYVSMLFKQETGENFSYYLEKLRIKNACELLINTNLNIDEIATRLDYSNSSSFGRAFKRHKGMRPSDYRLKLNQK